jgi:hypothetical protein
MDRTKALRELQKAIRQRIFTLRDVREGRAKPVDYENAKIRERHAFRSLEVAIAEEEGIEV